MNEEKHLGGPSPAAVDGSMATSADPSAIARHTPGPWRWVYDGSIHYSIGEDDDPQAKRVAGVYDRNHKRAAANCDLIAAAPEMYEALKSAQDRLCDAFCPRVDGEFVAGHTVGCKRASEAIAKAEGR